MRLISREAPQFSRKILPANINDENELLFLDTHLLTDSILNEMHCVKKNKMRIYDYVFMCFLLGNDFLPHFPCINIRRNGIDQLMKIYSIHMGKYDDRYFISKDTMEIQWKWVKLFFHEIGKLEHGYFVEEYTFRNKQSNNHNYNHKTKNKGKEPKPIEIERLETVERVCMEYRGDEHYICPTDEGWEYRYYHITTNEKPTPELISKITHNYIEGLEWVFKYYTQGCPHWQWKYNYHYPPLFVDLVKNIPSENHKNVLLNYPKINRPFHPSIQLLYVIPKTAHSSLLPENVRKISEKNNDYFGELSSLKFKWMFCTYLWEAHVCLPEISLDVLGKWEEEIVGGSNKSN